MMRTFCLAVILVAGVVGHAWGQVAATAELISPGSNSVEHLPPVEPTSVAQETVSRAEWAAPETETQGPPGEAATQEVDREATADAVVEQLRTPSWRDLSLWEGSFELGLSGSEGNSRTLNFHSGFDAKRKTTTSVLDLDLDYHKKTADTVETAHRLFFDVRWERLFQQSPWTWFVHHGTDYDEFTAYDVRLTFDTGVGRKLIDTEATSLLARLGAGCSHEIGSPDDAWVPELALGLDWEHKLSDRQKLTASVDYTPDVTQLVDFRLKSKAGWEVLLDEEMNLSLRVSVLDRYDSTPNGSEPNDLDYTITLLWSF